MLLVCDSKTRVEFLPSTGIRTVCLSAVDLAVFAGGEAVFLFEGPEEGGVVAEADLLRDAAQVSVFGHQLSGPVQPLLGDVAVKAPAQALTAKVGHGAFADMEAPGGVPDGDLLRQMLSVFRTSVDTMSVEEKRAAIRTVVRKVIWDGVNAHVILFGADEQIEFPDIKDRFGSDEEPLEEEDDMASETPWGEDSK